MGAGGAEGAHHVAGFKMLRCEAEKLGVTDPDAALRICSEVGPGDLCACSGTGKSLQPAGFDFVFAPQPADRNPVTRRYTGDRPFCVDGGAEDFQPCAIDNADRTDQRQYLPDMPRAPVLIVRRRHHGDGMAGADICRAVNADSVFDRQSRVETDMLTVDPDTPQCGHDADDAGIGNAGADDTAFAFVGILCETGKGNGSGQKQTGHQAGGSSHSLSPLPGWSI